MPARYEINPSLGLVVSTCSGALSDSDVRLHIRTLAADPLFHPDMSELWDLTQVTRFDISAEVLQESAALRNFSLNSKRAIVASNSEGFGIGRMFENLSEYFKREHVEVFRDLESAMLWLNSDPK